MGFSERELVNINAAALQANTFDANSSAVWYEKVLSFQFVLSSTKIWTQISSIPAADTLNQARINAAANPTVIQDLSQNADAVRLAEVPGTNKSTWACYGLVGGVPTPGQPITANWILPQLIPNSAGNPSSGYGIRLYNGDPAAGGAIVNPGDGQTGSGEEKSVAWVFNYASGALLLSSDFYTRTGINSNTFDPYIVGFRYIGSTAGGGSGTIGGTINNTEVAFGTGADQIGGAADFTYDTTNNLLEVEKIDAQVVIQVRNETGVTIPAGSAVYVSADGGSGTPLVSLAQANAAATMPSIGIVPNAIDTGNNGFAVITGQVNGLDGSAGNTVFDSQIVAGDVGKVLYVSPTNAGRLTLTKPTGATEPIQNVGKVIDVNGNNVKISVSNIGRTNDVPNSFSTTGNINAGSLTVNSAFTFPTADGTSGQALVTDGAGNVVFGSPSNSDFSVVLDEAVTAGDVIRLSTSGDVGGTPGRGRKALATSGDNIDAIGIAASSGVTGGTIDVILFGVGSITFSVAPGTDKIGKDIYLSPTTSGAVTFTAPTGSGQSVVRIGKLLFANGIDATQQCKIDIDLISEIN